MRKLLFFLTSYAALVACTSVPTVNQPLVVVEKPGLNEMTSVELGGLVLDKGRFLEVEALDTKNNIDFPGNALFPPITMPAGILYAGRRDQNYTYYFSRGAVMHDPLAGDIPLREEWGLRVNNMNPADVIGINMLGRWTRQPSEKPILVQTKYVRFDASSYRQQIAYGGRNGDVLRLQYREIPAGATQAPINQDFEWDLRDGSIISFGGAKIEVLEATNLRLGYRVLTSFADRTPR